MKIIYLPEVEKFIRRLDINLKEQAAILKMELKDMTYVRELKRLVERL